MIIIAKKYVSRLKVKKKFEEDETLFIELPCEANASVAWDMDFIKGLDYEC